MTHRRTSRRRRTRTLTAVAIAVTPGRATVRGAAVHTTGQMGTTYFTDPDYHRGNPC